MIHVAMIEDDLELASLLTQYLKTYDIEVTNFSDPLEGLEEIAHKEYQLIILDLTLPHLDGLDICQDLIEKYHLPIIISSARSDITDKVVALKLGAEDYLPKPYDPRELELRIRNILRHYEKSVVPSKEHKTFTYDLEKQLVFKNQQMIKLTPAENELMLLFLQREGFVIGHEDIFDEVDIFKTSEHNINSLFVIINRIRQKIEEDSKHPQYLQTIKGLGYKFVQ
jgi:two-component system OmpR family response regulator